MKKKILIISVLIILGVLIAAVITKPDDKKIMIYVIDEVWGSKVPNVYKSPRFYNQFMNTTTQNIVIDDWIFLKRIRYIVTDEKKVIGYAAFGKIIL
jgi:hypothetical protein